MSKVDQLRALREARAAARGNLTPVFSAATRRAPVAPIVTQPARPAPNPEPSRSPAPSDAPTSGSASVPAPTTPSAPAGVSTGRPNLTPGKPIHAYKDSDLDALVAWITTTGQASTLEDVTTVVMSELGFLRRGKNIRSRVAESLHRTNR